MAVMNESRGTAHPENPHHHHPGHLAEDARKATRSEDEPMGRRSPQAPFAFVALSYLAALAVAGLVIGLVLFAMA